MDSELQPLRTKPCVSAFGSVHEEDTSFPSGASACNVATPSQSVQVKGH